MKIEILGYKINVMKIPDQTQLGSYSLCMDGLHVLYLDYDQLPLQIIINEIKSIQEMYDIGNIYIFESSLKKYHAVSLDKINIKEYYRIMQWLNVDPNHAKGPYYNNMNSFVLRMSDAEEEHIRLVGTLARKSKRQKSKAHAKMFNLKYPGMVKITKQFDNNDKLNICQYETYKKERDK